MQNIISELSPYFLAPAQTKLMQPILMLCEAPFWSNLQKKNIGPVVFFYAYCPNGGASHDTILITNLSFFLYFFYIYLSVYLSILSICIRKTSCLQTSSQFDLMYKNSPYDASMAFSNWIASHVFFFWNSANSVVKVVFEDLTRPY